MKLQLHQYLLWSRGSYCRHMVWDVMPRSEL